jgi:hypothetical protein
VSQVIGVCRQFSRCTRELFIACQRCGRWDQLLGSKPSPQQLVGVPVPVVQAEVQYQRCRPLRRRRRQRVQPVMPCLALCAQEGVPIPAEGPRHVEHDALATVVQADGWEQLPSTCRCSVELLLPKSGGEPDAVLREEQLALQRQPPAPNHIARAEWLAVLQPGGCGCAVLAAGAVECEGAGEDAELGHRRHDGASDADRNGAAR